MIIQVYEISNPLEAKQVADAGVDHVGVLVGNGEFPREITPADARQVLDAIPRRSKKVVLTLSRDLAVIANIAEQLQPDILHIGTVPEGISLQQMRTLKMRFPDIALMRSIPVTGEKSIELAKQYDSVADFLLLDSHKMDDNQIGATGMTHDWGISRKIVDSVKIPVILAGGLGPENVADAIRQVHPAGVDSKTKTDKKGSHEKDPAKVKRFVDAARHAGAQTRGA